MALLAYAIPSRLSNAFPPLPKPPATRSKPWRGDAACLGEQVRRAELDMFRRATIDKSQATVTKSPKGRQRTK